MAKTKLHVIHNIAIKHQYFYEIEIDLPDGLTEHEVQQKINYSEDTIRSLFNLENQYDQIVSKYTPFEGKIDVSLISYDEIPNLSKKIDKISSEKIKQWQDKQIKPKMILCPTGEFWMGAVYDEKKIDWDKSTPKHLVKITSFLMSETTVTQSLWQSVMGWNPSFFRWDQNLPVENIGWFDALVFCNQLSQLEGLEPCFHFYDMEFMDHSVINATVEWNKNANGFRLPTEAEWEYAAKAGSEMVYSGSNDINEVAWYQENSNNETHIVKTKKPNAWGLYDMSGNVWEWCMDQFDENAYKHRENQIVENPVKWHNTCCVHVLRGGSCGRPNDRCRVDYRPGLVAKSNINRGIRLVRSMI